MSDHLYEYTKNRISTIKNDIHSRKRVLKDYKENFLMNEESAKKHAKNVEEVKSFYENTKKKVEHNRLMEDYIKQNEEYFHAFEENRYVMNLKYIEIEDELQKLYVQYDDAVDLLAELEKSRIRNID